MNLANTYLRRFVRSRLGLGTYLFVRNDLGAGGYLFTFVRNDLGIGLINCPRPGYILLWLGSALAPHDKTTTTTTANDAHNNNKWHSNKNVWFGCINNWKSHEAHCNSNEKNIFCWTLFEWFEFLFKHKNLDLSFAFPFSPFPHFTKPAKTFLLKNILFWFRFFVFARRIQI